MTKRSEHLFQFTGRQIGEAAEREAKYHADRIVFWTKEQRAAIDRAKIAGLEVSEYPVTGGVRAQMCINPVLQERINECANKLQKHIKTADTLQIEAACYRTQGERTYELHPDDVVYFRLAGGPREE